MIIGSSHPSRNPSPQAFEGGPDAQEYLGSVQSDDETIQYVGPAEDGFAQYELILEPSSAQ